MNYANENVWIFAQIESQLGYDNLDEILAVDGLHAIAFGPFDLGTSLGYPGKGVGHPEIDRIQTDMTERAHAAGKRIMPDYVSLFSVGTTVSGQMRQFVSEQTEPFK